MARPQAIAVAGYYPTPPPLISALAALLTLGKAGAYAVVDPCAGEGAAVCALVAEVFCPKLTIPDEIRRARGDVDLYACEMEASRFKALEARRGKHGEPIPYGKFHAVKGDAFRVAWSSEDPGASYKSDKRGAGLLFLNPPYMGQGVWEHRFLQRFADVLQDEGVLLFLIPYKSLDPCADTLAAEFRIAACYRFPDEHFGFSQVVLVATKRPRLLVPDAKVKARLIAWSKAPEKIPVLPAHPSPVATVPGAPEYKAGFGQWAVAPVDLTALRARTRAWHTTDRGGKLSPIAGILPDRPVRELLSPTYPVAMPPRAAHIAAGIAAGVFNGARIQPDDPTTGLPEILVKGTFTRDFVAVEEKEDKHGEVIGEIQVQQPSLVVTVLDLTALKYHTITSSAEITGARTVETMTTADLLATYGRGLMKVMLAQCPVLHDPSNPAHAIPLPAVKRPLFRAQADATMATVKLLGGLSPKLPPGGVARLKALRAERARRTGKAAFVLGEIGSGKTTVASVACKAINADVVLVMCPPHLTPEWRDQVGQVFADGEARAVILDDVLDVDRVAAEHFDGITFAILSRETAKLGHAWSSVRNLCPECGAPVPYGDLAKVRARCGATYAIPLTPLAHVTRRLAEGLLSVFPGEWGVRSLIRGRHLDKLSKPVPADAPQDFAAERAQRRWEAIAPSMRPVVIRLLDRIVEKDEEVIANAAKLLLHAIGDDNLTEFFCEELYEGTVDHPDPYGPEAIRRRWAREVALFLPPNGPEQARLRAHLHGLGCNLTHYGEAMTWEKWDEARGALAAGDNLDHWNYREIGFADDGSFMFAKHARGSAGAALAALEILSKVSKWKSSRPCGAILFEAAAELVKEGEVVAHVNRFPLATYIAKHHPDFFDVLVLDEGHEYSGEGSAQGFAAHRLVALRKPTIILTGSVMNGYARSLFANQWATDPAFRREFDRDEVAAFERRYGYIRQFVDFREGGKAAGAEVEHGAVTDRVETGARTIGSAPGVLPLFILRYLLRISVTLHKSDLAIDLPPHVDSVELVQVDAEMRSRFEALQKALVAQIRRDKYSKDRAGKLFGMLAELPSYLDRATSDTGNVSDGRYVISYPESVKGGGIVCEQAPFPASTILPKERWMLDKVKASLRAGIRPIIYAHHEVVLPRLARLIEEELGWAKGACPVLYAKKVQAVKRKEWITEKVVKPGREVLVVNPMAVQTGLNNLVWFRRAIWMENPACNPIVKRQADGRIDRIGKLGETESIFPVYEETAQEAMHKLLMHKVGVSMATDGLDAESALAAAGIGSGGAFESLSVGRQLFRLLTDDAPSFLTRQASRDVLALALAGFTAP